MNWPPEYTIKRSKRARRMSIKIEDVHGLQIVLPMRMSEKHVLPFIEHSREWIEKHLPIALANPHNEKIRELPDSLPLRAINEIWAVDYVKTAGPVRIISRPHEELVVMGDIDNRADCREKICSWLRKQAKKTLVEQTREFAEQFNFTVNRISIRDQKTRWGSCCSNKNINLNYKLIFLPKKLVDYVIIHELCHTVHLDHSPRFWGLVERFIPDYKIYKKQAAQERCFLPLWLKVL